MTIKQLSREDELYAFKRALALIVQRLGGQSMRKPV